MQRIVFDLDELKYFNGFENVYLSTNDYYNLLLKIKIIPGRKNIPEPVKAFTKLTTIPSKMEKENNLVAVNFKNLLVVMQYLGLNEISLVIYNNAYILKRIKNYLLQNANEINYSKRMLHIIFTDNKSSFISLLDDINYSSLNSQQKIALLNLLKVMMKVAANKPNENDMQINIINKNMHQLKN
jgi:hypothetical protein